MNHNEVDHGTPSRRRLLLGAAALAGTAGLGVLPATRAVAQPSGMEQTLHRWAVDTWRSPAAMAHPDTGLVADNIDGTLATRSGYTSPTNIGGYLQMEEFGASA